MKLIYHETRKRYEFLCEYGEHYPAKKSRFRWDPDMKRWWTDDPEKASKLIQYADPETHQALASIAKAKQRNRHLKVVRQRMPILRYPHRTDWNTCHFNVLGLPMPFHATAC